MNFIVDDQKITRYLLNASGSPEARGKATFFFSIGYLLSDPERLRRSLLAHASSATRRPDETDLRGYGRKIIFECHLPNAPNGGDYCVRSVWIDTGDTCRLVTAYPCVPPAP